MASQSLSTETPRENRIFYNGDPKGSRSLNTVSKCLIITAVVTGIISVLAIVFCLKNVFGSVGSIGFIASIAGGGVSGCIAIGSLIGVAVALLKGKNQKLPNLIEGFREKAEKIFPYFYGPLPSDLSIQKMKGGGHICLIADALPDIVLKKVNDDIDGLFDLTSYVTRAEKAEQICEEYNLYYLYVPKCGVLEFNKSVIWQEKIELEQGEEEYTYQEALYQKAIYSEDPSVIKEVLKQLAILICLTGFSDIKYDNICFTKKGRVVLFDLDIWGAVKGLTRGNGRSEGGLFNMLPPEWFDEFVEFVEKYLSEQDFLELKKHLPALKCRAEERKKHKEEIEVFYERNDPASPQQLLVFDKTLFTGYQPKVCFFAEKMIECLNQQTAKPHYLGREITVERGMFIDFYKSLGEFLNIDCKDEEYQSVREEGLRALQELGYIFSYKIDLQYVAFSVIY